MRYAVRRKVPDSFSDLLGVADTIIRAMNIFNELSLNGEQNIGIYDTVEKRFIEI